MIVPLLPSWFSIDDLLSMLALLQLASLELLLFLVVPEICAQLVTLIIYDVLVGVSDKAL